MWAWRSWGLRGGVKPYSILILAVYWYFELFRNTETLKHYTKVLSKASSLIGI